MNNDQKNNIMVFLVEKKSDTEYNIIGIAPLYSQAIENNNLNKKYLFASKLALAKVKECLLNGDKITVPINIDHEVNLNDITIIEQDELSRSKNLALVKINELINQNIFAVSVITAMDYLNCYMKLLAAGIFITDKNREDKYFEIIEAAQENEEPKIPNENASFEEEQKYIEDKAKYDFAQDNLMTLEKYLNAYDKLSKINFVNTLLNNIKDSILNAQNINEVDLALNKDREILNHYFYNDEINQHNSSINA